MARGTIMSGHRLSHYSFSFVQAVTYQMCNMTYGEMSENLAGLVFISSNRFMVSDRSRS